MCSNVFTVYIMKYVHISNKNAVKIIMFNMAHISKSKDDI